MRLKKKESLWQKDKPILSFTVLHPNRSLIKEERQSQQRRGGKEKNALVAETFSMKTWSFRVSSSMEEKTLVTKGKGSSLANEVPSVQASSRERDAFSFLQNPQ